MLSASLLVANNAHYAMIKPPSWQDPDGSSYSNWNPMFGWRPAGCTNATAPPGEEHVIGCYSQWYSNGTHIPGNRTLPDYAVTYQATCDNSWDPIVSSSFAAHRTVAMESPLHRPTTSGVVQ